jgi:hypothetical protein
MTKRLSSIVTLPYKLFVIGWGAIILPAVPFSFKAPENPWPIFLIIFGVFLWDVLRWKKVVLVDDLLYVSNYLRTYTVEPTEIIKVERSWRFWRFPRLVTIRLKSSEVNDDSIVFVARNWGADADVVAEELESLRRSKGLLGRAT